MWLLVCTFVAAPPTAAVLAWRSAEYRKEIGTLREGMSGIDKVKADLALASDARRLQVMTALAVRQARTDGDLLISISVDSGLLHLEQRGAVLRSALVQIAADGWQAIAGDSIPLASPLGVRRVQEVRGDTAVILTGGAVLYGGDPARTVRATTS